MAATGDVTLHIPCLKGVFCGVYAKWGISKTIFPIFIRLAANFLYLLGGGPP